MLVITKKLVIKTKSKLFTVHNYYMKVFIVQYSQIDTHNRNNLQYESMA